jgi:carboxypeptidase C (cathepsin A)
MGESYGGMRSPVLARYLDEQLGIKLDGVVLISPWLDAIGDMIFDSPDPADDLAYIDYLPEYATIAWYHKKIDPEFAGLTLEQVYEAAVKYAQSDYLDALALGDEVPQATRDAVEKRLSQFTGLPLADVQTNGLRISLDHFRSNILKDTGEVVSWYDGRMHAKVADPENNDPTDALNPIFAKQFTDYFGGILGIRSDLKDGYDDEYNFPSWPGANRAGAIEGGYLNVLTDINKLMTKNPTLKFYIASGLYDLTCPAAEVHFMVDHLDPAVAERIQIGHYPAGHPIYFGQVSAKQYSTEMSTFLTKRAPLP